MTCDLVAVSDEVFASKGRRANIILNMSGFRYFLTMSQCVVDYQAHVQWLCANRSIIVSIDFFVNFASMNKANIGSSRRIRKRVSSIH